MDEPALLLTLHLAVVTTCILLVIGVPLGFWLASSERRFTRICEAMVALPLVIPPTVLGFYLLVLLGPQTGLGRFLHHFFGHPIPFSFSGLVIGSVIYSLPFAVQPISAGFAAIDQDVVEAALLLEPSRSRVFRRILIPLTRRSILTGAVLAFTHTVGEFGVVLMLGGSIPGRTRTLSIAIYDQVQDMQYSAANQASLSLLIFSFAALLALYGSRSGSRV